jgi:para-nitrobenzyl esterase
MQKKVTCTLLIFVLASLLAACSDENDIRSLMKDKYGENKEITGFFDEKTAVKCSNGVFVGKDEDGVIAYKGIPFAEQPTGKLRWKPPVHAKDSSKVYEAYYFGHSPVQTEAASEPGSFYPQGEDCLNLNVWTNRKNDSEKKPVMVFFHGGSYGWGATSDPMYDGHNLISKFDDVILVTAEYRTGIMGFMDFSKVKGGEEYKESGNLGLLDQKCALEWVQRNISAFGGDPGNVTIFGESAGGGSVSLLPLMKGTDGLFRRIIAQSGSVALTFSREECQELTKMLLKETRCKTMKELVALPAEKLKEANENLNDYANFPERDGIVLPLDLYEEYKAGKTARYDMMQGTNADEFRCFIWEMEEMAPGFPETSVYEHTLPVLYENDMKRLSAEEKAHVARFMKMQGREKKIWKQTEFYNEVMFRIPAMKQAEYHSAAGGNSYVYYWTYPCDDEVIGACHAVELSYVFNNLEDKIYTGDNVNKELADVVQNMWVSFARDGDPSYKKFREYKWEQYDSKDRKTMILGEDVHMENDVKSAQRKEIEPILHHYINGCHSKLDLNVPQTYRIAFQLLASLVLGGSAIAWLLRRRKDKKQY